MGEGMKSDSSLVIPEVLSLSQLKVNLFQDVYNHLNMHYSSVGSSHLENILEHMKISPAATCCRVNLLKASVDEVIEALKSHLSEMNDDTQYTFERHETITDLVIIKGNSSASDIDFFHCSVPPTTNSVIEEKFSSWRNRRKKGWPMSHRAVVVDRFCAEAVLRGAHIFVKGILSSDAGITEGEDIAVYAHLSSNAKQVPRGLLLENYVEKCVFLGIGKSNCKRSDYFARSTGIGITMTQIAGPTLPALNGVLIGKIMLQNLPSALVAHILDPQKGDVILDMCSCPGGKTSHIASLIGNDGLVIACDKGKKKMIEARDFFKSMNATCIVPISTDSTKLFLPVDKQNKLTPKDIVDAATFENNDDLLQIEGFNPGSFDRILLDPPCSALGLRPKLQVDIKTSEDLWKHADYQKQFVRCAVPLLKNGGIMTYSTCTINASENEEMVKFIITEFPCMKLLPISEEFPGLPGLPGVGLSEEECKMVRRFDPCNKTIDSMGFFIAKFQKL